MPFDIVEVDEFTSVVTAPEGTDKAGLTYLLTAFQSLANRTRNLKRLLTEYTLQDGYDASDAAVDSPMIETETGVSFGGLVSGSPTVKAIIGGANAIFEALPAASGAVAFIARSAGKISLFNQSNDKSFTIGAPITIFNAHGITTPSSHHALYKAALVRAKGADVQPTEWMPMDGDEAWAPVVTAVTNASNVILTRAAWSQSGKVVSFSANGTLDAIGTGLVKINIPKPAAVSGGSGVMAVFAMSNGDARPAQSDSSKVICEANATVAGGLLWSVTGQLIAP